MKKIKILLVAFLIVFIIIVLLILYKKNFRSKNINNKILLSNPTNKMTTLKITPLDFQNNDFIPKEFTCDWENRFPAFKLENLSENAKNLTILVEDPDAPMERPFVHLMVANIPITWNNLIIDESSLNQWVLWTNDFWNLWWWWPCPPHWHWIHHYHFKFFILDTDLPLATWFTLNEFLQSLENYKDSIVGYWEVIGLYQR